MFFFLLAAPLRGQADSVLVVRGQVVGGGGAVPYATLQLQGTSVGVVSNDAGHYELRLPAGSEGKAVVVRSIGFRQAVRSVGSLLKEGRIMLQTQPIDLREVQVSDYRDGRSLVNAVVERARRNCHQRTAWSTFFCRDWRALQGELYLFDEAVMRVQRAPYAAYADKRGYVLNPCVREIESNIKTLLRHRLLVLDQGYLQRHIRKQLGVYQCLEFSDNDALFDPLATPQASYPLARRMLLQHRFEPIQQFTADGEQYYLVRSVGPSRSKGSSRYEYIIRRSDLALVRLTSVKVPVRVRAPQSAWVNVYFTHLHLDADSTVWTYGLRDSAYTLTRYYNAKTYRLTSHNRGCDGEVQRWEQSVDWHLTDFSLTAPPPGGEPIEVKPQTLGDAFGSSDYSSDFWGLYNAIPLDTLPLRLLQQKFNSR